MLNLIIHVAILSLFTATIAVAQPLDYRPTEPMRFKIHANLAGLWDGVVDANEITIEPNSSIEIKNLTLTDRAGRNRLKLQSARASLVTDQNGFNLAEIKLERPQLIIWRDKEEANLPHEASFSNGRQKKRHSYFSKFERLIAKDAELIIASSLGQARWDGINLSAERIGTSRTYGIKINRNKFQSIFEANGIIDRQIRSADITVTANHTIKNNEGAILSSLFEMPVIHDGNGQASARLRFSGRFDTSDILWPTGEIVLTKAAINTSDAVLMDNFNAQIVFPERRLVIFQDMNADSFGGKFEGSAYIESKTYRTEYGGHLVFRNAGLAKFATVAGPYNFLSKGKGQAIYDFTGTSGRIEDYKARGVIFLDDADLWKMPGVSHLFSFLELGQKEPLTYSDAVAAFDVNGPVITIQRANISSGMTGIEFLAGMKINYETKYVDGHAVFVPLEKVRNIFNSLPFFSAFTKAADQLAGVSIRGYLWEAPHQLIRKEPVQDIQAATVDFFGDMAKSGGQIGNDVYEQMENFFGMGSLQKKQQDDRRR